MVILVTGSRTFEARHVIRQALLEAVGDAPTSSVLIVHGGAPGADSLADSIATALGWHTAIVNARWDFYDKAAGPVRNEIMANCFTLSKALVFNDDLESSPGTKHMVKLLNERSIPYTHYHSDGTTEPTLV